MRGAASALTDPSRFRLQDEHRWMRLLSSSLEVAFGASSVRPLLCADRHGLVCLECLHRHGSPESPPPGSRSASPLTVALSSRSRAPCSTRPAPHGRRRVWVLPLGYKQRRFAPTARAARRARAQLGPPRGPLAITARGQGSGGSAAQTAGPEPPGRWL
jgi:hypothetical protein